MLALQAGEAAARNERDRLEEVERRIGKSRGRDAALSRHAGTLAREVRTLREQVVSAARRLQIQEAVLIRVELDLGRLEAAIREDDAEYRRNEQQFLRIAGALRRIRSNPPGVLAMHFADAQDAVHSKIVLRSLVPQLRVRAGQLRRKVADYNKRRRKSSKQREDIAAKAAQLRRTRQELAALLGRRIRLLAQTREEKAEVRRRLVRLTREAETLQDLMTNLERENTGAPLPPVLSAALTRPDRLRRFREARGKVVAPVSARVVERFSDRDRLGLAVNGLRFAARAGAQAVAPYDGQIVFAG